MQCDRLSLYLASLGAPVCQESATWGGQVLRVQSYVGSGDPPAEFVTSARCVVLRGDQVLVVRDPDDLHIIPGGRCAPGESFEQTAVREVGEETGWLVDDLRLIGAKHFQHLSPKPPRYPHPYPIFLQLIYAGRAQRYCAELKEVEGWELGAEFVPVTGPTVGTLRLSERHFLAAARRVMATHPPTWAQPFTTSRRSFAL